MKFGTKHEDKSLKYVWFAWYPVHLEDGRWAWLEPVSVGPDPTEHGAGGWVYRAEEQNERDFT